MKKVKFLAAPIDTHFVATLVYGKGGWENRELKTFSTLDLATDFATKNTPSDAQVFISKLVAQVDPEEDPYEAALEYFRSIDKIPHTIKQQKAFDKLLTIAAAWNKQDGFVADWNSSIQDKYIPSINCALTGNPIRQTTTRSHEYTPFVFGSEKRAKQFCDECGDLFREYLSPVTVK
jgi:hypothetical protein